MTHKREEVRNACLGDGPPEAVKRCEMETSGCRCYNLYHGRYKKDAPRLLFALSIHSCELVCFQGGIRAAPWFCIVNSLSRILICSSCLCRLSMFSNSAIFRFVTRRGSLDPRLEGVRRILPFFRTDRWTDSCAPRWFIRNHFGSSILLENCVFLALFSIVYSTTSSDNNSNYNILLIVVQKADTYILSAPCLGAHLPRLLLRV